MSFRGSCRAPVLVLVFLALAAAGCGGPRVVKVSGTVTRGGRPVDKLQVTFQPEHGRPSWGITDKDGHYTLNYERGRDGAVTGTHKVWVRVQPTSAKEEADLARGLVKLHPEMNRILEKYGNLKTTPLTREVKEDDQVIDLQLD
jgi:hypothetical protein